jgi:glyoxylase I family protein
MTRSVLYTSAVVLLFASSALAQAAKPQTAPSSTQPGKAGAAQKFEAAAIAREKSLAEAEKRHDWESISRHLADDFVEIAGNGKLYTKAEVAQYFPDVRVQEATLDNFRVLRLGPDAVLLFYTADAKATFKGQPIPGRNYVSSYWARRAGKWRMVFHQATPIPEEGSK